MRVAALIPAAGAGRRLGLGPKAFVELDGVSLLERAVATLADHVDEVLAAVPAERRPEAERRAPGVRFVTGGASRQETVARLAAAATAELVLVHDAARPFLAGAVVERVARAAARVGAASAVWRVADSLVAADTGAPVDREGLRAVQTPQGFRRELLVEAHARAAAEGRTATDDAQLVRALPHAVALVEGSAWLFKVTTPEDLALARAAAAAFRG